MLNLVEATLNDWEDQLFSSGGNAVSMMQQVSAAGRARGAGAGAAAAGGPGVGGMPAWGVALGSADCQQSCRAAASRSSIPRIQQPPETS
jgi:hypothetical protein